MKRIKFIFAAMCAIALVAAFALVGCSSGGSSSAASGSASGSASASSASASASSASASTSSAAASGEAVELQIFAANSLSKAMEEAQALYTQKNPNVTFAATQYEASGTLNEMLGAGQYADLLITASKGTMDTAVEKKYVDEATRLDLFKNDLVMVTGENNADITSASLDDVAAGKFNKVAIGDDNVPAGNYANQSLSTVGCYNDPDGKTGSECSGKGGNYDGTPLEGKVVLGAKVGDVCKYAEAGDADIAFVYTSDVYRIGGVKIVGTVPADTHKKILYPGAVTADSKNADAAKAFLDWCATDKDALEIWQKWGFELTA